MGAGSNIRRHGCGHVAVRIRTWAGSQKRKAVATQLESCDFCDRAIGKDDSYFFWRQRTNAAAALVEKRVHGNEKRSVSTDFFPNVREDYILSMLKRRVNLFDALLTASHSPQKVHHSLDCNPPQLWWKLRSVCAS